MSKRVVVDPITRIEGHLRAEVIVGDDGVVQDAFISSTLWRGLEVIAKGRDPRNIPLNYAEDMWSLYLLSLFKKYNGNRKCFRNKNSLQCRAC